MTFTENDASITRQINCIHSLDDIEEKERIEQSGGFIASNQLKPYLPLVSRVYANAEHTRGGLTMSRSIGDQRIHKYGVISTPTLEKINLHEYPGEKHLFLGSDGFLSYTDKTKILLHFNNANDLSDNLASALSFAFHTLLNRTNGKYADDTSGIVLRFR